METEGFITEEVGIFSEYGPYDWVELFDSQAHELLQR
jgi:hypothetical protein